MNNEVFNTALEVMKRAHTKDYDALNAKIEEIKSAAYVNEVSREADLTDLLENDRAFVRCLVVVVDRKFRAASQDSFVDKCLKALLENYFAYEGRDVDDNPTGEFYITGNDRHSDCHLSELVIELLTDKFGKDELVRMLRENENSG